MMMPELTGVIVLLFLIVLFLSLNMRILKEDQVIIVERFGKYNRIIKEKGIHFLLPFVDRPIEQLSLKPIDDSFIDKRNQIKFDIKYQITDPYTFTYANLDTYQKTKEIIINSYIINRMIDLESLNISLESMGLRLIHVKSYNI
jgi:regulator of protease activity HflC (stomatin/prohibitin superfamily)